MVSVGGFFASLKLVTDDNSIQQGIAKFSKVPTSLKAVAVGAVGVAAGMVALATETASALTKLDAQSRALGMNARTLDNWKQAVNLAGGDADGFVQSLVTMNEAFRNLKIGEVKEDFIKATGMSGANFAALQGMNNDQRFRAIWGALEKVSDKDKQAALIEKIFGAGGLETFYRAQQQGTSLTKLYGEADTRNPLTNQQYNKAIEADTANREIGVSLKKAMDDVGMEISIALLPSLKRFSIWLKDNPKALDDFARAIGQATTVVVGLINGIVSVISGITGWVSDADKKQKYLEDRKVYSGLGMTNAQLGMLYGTGPENEYYKKYASGELTLEQINKIDTSIPRFNLFKNDQAQLAASLPENAIQFIAKKAAEKAKKMYPGAVPGETDPRMANLESIQLKTAKGMTDILKGIGSNPKNIETFSRYAGLIENNAALSAPQKNSAEKEFFERIATLEPKTNVTFTINQDKSGALTITDDKGRTVASSAWQGTGKR